MAVSIISAPENRIDRNLVYATWALAATTAALCIITLLGLRKQSRDMGESISAANHSAEAAQLSAVSASQHGQVAARQRREALEREVNLAERRVITTAELIAQLADRVPRAKADLFALSGRRARSEDPVNAEAKYRKADADAAVESARALTAPVIADKSDAELAGALMVLDSHLVQLKGAKELILRELTDLADQIRIFREWSARNAREPLPPID